jgi:hypothetical protein
MAQARRPSGAYWRLDGDEIDPDGQCRQGRPIGQDAQRDQPQDGPPQVVALAAVECLLRQTEAAIAPPADLDDHEHARWSGIDRDEVDLASADAQAARDDSPPVGRQPRGDDVLRLVPGSLLGRPSAGHAADDVTSHSSATYPADDSSSSSPGPTAAQSTVCSTSATEEKVSRWIAVVPCSRRPARCSGAA